MSGRPTHLPALVRWFCEAAADDIPTRINSSALDAGGAPQWHGSFRAWLTAHPAAVDKEGHVRSPFRFWLHSLHGEGRGSRVRSLFLYRLARLEGDWLAAVRSITPLTDDGEIVARDFATQSLQRFWDLMSTEPRRIVRAPKSEAQHRAEEAA